MNATKKGIMASFSYLSSIVLLLAIYGVTTSTASSNVNHEKGIVSLKLNSRHTELERRRRERRHLAENDSENEQLEYNEEKYRRREDAVQVGALFEVSCGRNVSTIWNWNEINWIEFELVLTFVCCQILFL